MPNKQDINRRALFTRLTQLQGGANRPARRTNTSSSPSLNLPSRDPVGDAEIIQKGRFTRRTLMLGAGSLSLFGLLAGKLYNLQRIEGRKYTSLADDNRLAVRFHPSIRGRILDRSGTVIASNVENLRVLLTPGQTKNITTSLDLLEKTIHIPHKQRQFVLQTAKKQNPQLPILVIDGLAWSQFARINVLSARIPGISGDIGWKRFYHYGEESAHITGYLGQPDDLQLAAEPALRLPGSKVGVMGLEKGFDRVLRGTPGRTEIEVDARGRTVKDLEKLPPRHGTDLSLTLDMSVQQKIFSLLGPYHRAAAVAMEINSGDVIASCSTPSFDPNILTEPIDKKKWRTLQKAPHNPMSDKATRGQYPPGSTFKMVTALAGLEAGAITSKTRFTCNGHMTWNKHRFHCWNRSGHGETALHRALKQSCDVYFYETARKLGIKRLAKMARHLGLGEAYSCGLPGQKAGLIPDPDWKQSVKGKSWYGGETVLAGIGQGYVLTTPLQLAVMTARIASGRQIMPRLARPVDETKAPRHKKLEISEKSLKLVRKGMAGVINERDGTATGATLGLPGLQMAGKTGTSQVRGYKGKRRKNKELEWKYRDHALFVAYAPVKNPRYAVSVIIEHGESGGRVAGPVARDIMKVLLARDPASQSPKKTRPSELSTARNERGRR